MKIKINRLIPNKKIKFLSQLLKLKKPILSLLIIFLKIILKFILFTCSMNVIKII